MKVYFHQALEIRLDCRQTHAQKIRSGKPMLKNFGDENFAPRKMTKFVFLVLKIENLRKFNRPNLEGMVLRYAVAICKRKFFNFGIFMHFPFNFFALIRQCDAFSHSDPPPSWLRY